MDIYEAMVLRYLTATPNVFVRWQQSIPDPEGKEWSCPDFVAIDIAKKRIFVVEVSSAYDIRGLIRKANRCDHQWLDLLRKQFDGIGFISAERSCEVEVFARKDAINRFGSELQNQIVKLRKLESIGFPWLKESTAG
jgi:hypothetical protein